MAKDGKKLPTQSSSTAVDEFVRQMALTPAQKTAAKRGRLLFAMDATASREPTWDIACDIQAQMFLETDALGGLDVQLIYYRGFGECKTTAWLGSAEELVRRMTRVSCLGGRTQIRKVLKHAIKETARDKIDALVFVGDCVEEDVDHLCDLAGRLGLAGVPVFIFHEGYEPVAESAFRQIARLTRGAYCRFDAGSAKQLRDLLSAVAVYAAGGRKALEDFGKRAGAAVRQITHQMD
jgi:hypothetical protein